jgi:methylenetetrahydrofolate dehydrogenase (NADP+)/methenyltetrahydrofolate cyclohydrolase
MNNEIRRSNQMEPLLLDGTAYAKEVQAGLKVRADEIIKKSGVTPALATILVGDNPASVMYIRMKGNACKRVGINFLKIEMPGSSTTEDVLNEIKRLNESKAVSGILLQSPLPKQIDQQKCFNAIAFEKDADGVNVSSFGAMTMGLPGFKPATPYAIMCVLERYNIQIAGKKAVVIGRSPILGKPVSMLLLNADATVTICHSKTQDLPDIVRQADIIVAALGKPLFVKADWVKEGAVLVDAGYNEGNVGDIDLENCIPKSSAYTPVPGGIGPVTIIKLIEQTISAAERQLL